MLKKFPVTNNGVEYQVEINHRSVVNEMWDIKLYKKGKKKLFSSDFNFIELFSNNFIVGEDEQVNFIHMAKCTIYTYERKQKEKHEPRLKRLEALHKFEDWDGVCNEN